VSASSQRIVAALVHAECGHACIVADSLQPVQEWARERGLADPQWEVAALPCGDAVERYQFGPCEACRQEGPQ